jgi:predicted DNA-binding protein with PD1-like motif
MNTIARDNDLEMIAYRFGPGTEIVTALLEEIQSRTFDGAAVVSATGSLESVKFTVAVFDADNHPTYGPMQHHQGAIEMASLGGHLGRGPGGEPALHLHGSFALSDGRVVGGHLFEARVLATVEITMLCGVAWTGTLYEHPGTAARPTFILAPGRRVR